MYIVQYVLECTEDVKFQCHIWKSTANYSVHSSASNLHMYMYALVTHSRISLSTGTCKTVSDCTFVFLVPINL